MAGPWCSVSKHLVRRSYYVVLAVTTGRNRKSAPNKRTGMKTVLGGVCSFTTGGKDNTQAWDKQATQQGLAEKEGSLAQQ